MYAPTPEKSSAGHTKIGWVPGGDLTSLVQGSWQQADDFYASSRSHSGGADGSGSLLPPSGGPTQVGTTLDLKFRALLSRERVELEVMF
jgi:hypothetical protein